ncbi:MAG: DUF1549 domain-containing protein, partial [bacterium]|nr:DUF1549 domain-containing protein [bacterium]
MFVCIARIPGIQRLCGIVLACFTFAVAAQSAESLDFSRDVLPILSDRCFFCHGPDSSHREADLRLDVQEAAHEWVVVPGKPDESELIRRVFSSDPDEVMPPPAAKIPLNESEKAILREWVESGAAYGQHWAFTPVRRPLVLSPGADEGTGSDSAQTQAAKGSKAANSGRLHPIDVLVQDRLRELGLTPSGEADRVTLIRRLSFDLTGLPPTIDEIDRFVGDADPNAYENLVGRLLQSSRFGERMAVDWLDVARYADTYGYQNDRYRDMWPWRDWVIGAFNDNLGYDEFITWQLAGDLLPNATSEQILATAFNRNHRQTNEGGSVEEEFRAEYVADRVNTFGAAFLGLTLECARCHDHKYDPITQREYYQLAAFFNSIDESGLYSHFTSATPTPTLLLPEPATEQSTTELRQKIQQRQQQLDELQPTEAGYQDWRQSLTDVRPTAFQAKRIASGRSLAELLTHSLQASLVGHFKFEDLEDDQLRNEVESGESGAVQDAPQLTAGRVGKGLLLSGDNSATVKAGGDFTRNDPFSISLWLQAPTRFERAVVYHRSRAWT